MAKVVFALILVLSGLLACLAEPEVVPSSQLWKNGYKTLFGSRPKDLSEAATIRLLVFLDKRSDQVHDESILDEEKALVRLWAKAMIDRDMNHCNPEHARKMYEHYQNRPYKGNRNQEYIYWLFRKNLLEFCSVHFQADFKEKIFEGVTASDEDLLKASDKYWDWRTNELSLRKSTALRKAIYKLAGTTSTGKALKVWTATGPCATIMNNLRANQAHHNFALLVNAAPVMNIAFTDKYRHSYSVIESWADVADMCVDLEKRVTDILKSSLVSRYLAKGS